MKHFNGRALFLDKNDINTDEIIPAKYLTEISKNAMKTHLLEDLALEEFIPRVDIPGKQVIISRSNFGCGSSREHAPWALETNGIHLVIAESFARIFRQNMFNCGMMAVELMGDTVQHLFTYFSEKEATVQTDLKKSVFTFTTDARRDEIPFTISDFDRALVKAGGWVEYADQH